MNNLYRDEEVIPNLKYEDLVPKVIDRNFSDTIVNLFGDPKYYKIHFRALETLIEGKAYVSIKRHKDGQISHIYTFLIPIEMIKPLITICYTDE